MHEPQPAWSQQSRHQRAQHPSSSARASPLSPSSALQPALSRPTLPAPSLAQAPTNFRAPKSLSSSRAPPLQRPSLRDSIRCGHGGACPNSFASPRSEVSTPLLVPRVPSYLSCLPPSACISCCPLPQLRWYAQQANGSTEMHASLMIRIASSCSCQHAHGIKPASSACVATPSMPHLTPSHLPYLTPSHSSYAINLPVPTPLTLLYPFPPLDPTPNPHAEPKQRLHLEAAKAVEAATHPHPPPVRYCGRCKHPRSSSSL